MRLKRCALFIQALATAAWGALTPADAQEKAAAPEAPAAIMLGRDIAQLPPEVQRMRQAILQAAATGDIEQLRVPIEMNELPPVFGKDAVKDPIAHFKALSGDGEGREILAILVELLTTGYAVKDAGTDKETIVWPYHAELPPKDLTPGQEVDLYRLVPPAALKEMREKGRYSFYRLMIGRDGVWHVFRKED